VKLLFTRDLGLIPSALRDQHGGLGAVDRPADNERGEASPRSSARSLDRSEHLDRPPLKPLADRDVAAGDATGHPPQRHIPGLVVDEPADLPLNGRGVIVRSPSGEG